MATEPLTDREQLQQLQIAIRKVRDTFGDDRCWLDLQTLYRLLPEGYIPPERDSTVDLENCKQFIASCHNPTITYVSPQRRIEELENKILRYERILKGLKVPLL